MCKGSLLLSRADPMNRVTVLVAHIDPGGKGRKRGLDLEQNCRGLMGVELSGCRYHGLRD